MTGNDWALSGIIAALLARGCCGDRVRGTDRFPELRQPCNAAELHLEEEKSAGTPPARCEMAAKLERVEYPLDQNGHWANWSSKALPKGEPSQDRTVHDRRRSHSRSSFNPSKLAGRRSPAGGLPAIPPCNGPANME